MKAVDSELRLRRLSIDEALALLEPYLYDAYMAGLSQVHIVHGKGTGDLRRAVQRFLSTSPLAHSYRPGGYGEGGYGVTVVELRER
jgi:DNA mismatch repair protein MutS2